MSEKVREDSGLISSLAPHGGRLMDLYATEEDKSAILSECLNAPRWSLTLRQMCDLELILNGGFSPLDGFVTEADYESIVRDLRLSDGTLFPLPMTLDVSQALADEVNAGDDILLCDLEGLALARLHITDKWSPDLALEAQEVYGTQDTKHPAVDYLLNKSGPVYLGGKLTGLNQVRHNSFLTERHTPKQMRELIAKKGWERVVAFQTRNPMHRAHVELVQRAGEENDAAVVINPVVGATKPGDIDAFSRVRCYRIVMDKLAKERSALSVLPLAMRMGGPREAVWHAILRKNFGFTHFIVGRDHAGPGKDSAGNDFYGPYDAQDLLAKYQDEVGIEIVPFKMMVYVAAEGVYKAIDEISEGTETLNISGTEFREMLMSGAPVPQWFSYPELVEELRRTHPPHNSQGLVLFMTGLSGSGKSSVANVLLERFNEAGVRKADLLDGDLVRKNLSSELGFSKEHRDLNIMRIGFVASLIARHGGIAICAPIAPYKVAREEARKSAIDSGAAFFEIHIAASLEVCESRDRKGLYAKARQGILKGMTGIDDPYEEPENPWIKLDTGVGSPSDAADKIIAKLQTEGYLDPTQT